MDPAWIIDEAPAGAPISSFSLLHWRPSPTTISIWAGLKLKVWLLLRDRQAELISELLFFIDPPSS